MATIKQQPSGGAHGKRPKDDFEPTKEELDRITEALKKKEFRDMFLEYAKEISDPKVRAEREAELNKLEQEKCPGAEKITLLNQIEHHYLETSNPQIYVNISSSAQIQNFDVQPATRPDGKKGLQIQIPCSVSPTVREFGRKRRVVDVCFGDGTIAHGELDAKFMDMQVDRIAIEHVNKFHKLKLNPETFQRGTKCGKVMGSLDGNIRYRPSSTPTNANAEPTDTESSESAGRQAALDHMREKLGNLKLDAPKYVVKEQYKSSLASGGSTGELPNAVIVRIELPNLPDKKGIGTDLTSKSIVVEFDAYYKRTVVDLPRKIDVDKSKVRWYKETRALLFTCPILKTEISTNSEPSQIFQDAALPTKHTGIQELSADDLDKYKAAAEHTKPPKSEAVQVPVVRKEPRVTFQEPEKELCPTVKFDRFTCQEDKLYLTMTFRTDSADQRFPRDFESLKCAFVSKGKPHFHFGIHLVFNVVSGTVLDGSPDQFDKLILNIRISTPSSEYIVVQFRKANEIADRTDSIRAVTVKNDAGERTVHLQDDPNKVKEVKKPPKINYAAMFKPSPSSIGIHPTSKDKIEELVTPSAKQLDRNLKKGKPIAILHDDIAEARKTEEIIIEASGGRRPKASKNIAECDTKPPTSPESEQVLTSSGTKGPAEEHKLPNKPNNSTSIPHVDSIEKEHVNFKSMDLRFSNDYLDDLD